MPHTSGFATTTLILGLLSVFIGWVPVLGWLLIVLTFVFGTIALRRIDGEEVTGRGLAIAGIVLAVFGLLSVLGSLKYFGVI